MQVFPIGRWQQFLSARRLSTSPRPTPQLQADFPGETAALTIRLTADTTDEDNDNIAFGGAVHDV